MIIGISGKIHSGKDLTGKIIQALTNKPDCFDKLDVVTEEEIDYKVWDSPKFVIHKFADTLKDFICMILGCTRKDLEDRDFKEKELPEEWWYWKSFDKKYGAEFPYHGQNMDRRYWEIIKPTPRLLLQLMGTECGRKILHPNIWVNAVMAKYKPILNRWDKKGNNMLPNWVITDMRFPNELEAVQKRGITIRVDRPNKYTTKSIEHASETALDKATFNYTIINEGSIKDLVNKIKQILIIEKLI